MRKKSHISLAKYIVESMQEEELITHKKAFYIGSILPDCKPSFITTKHEIEGTFGKVSEDIKHLVEISEDVKLNLRAFFRDLGQIIHYVADYFTFPHNEHYDGTLKDHCVYEEHLKKVLREYIKSGEAEKNKQAARKFETPEEICDFIKHSHELYMKIKTNVYEDCRHIVTTCCQVVGAVLQFLNIHISDVLLNAA